MDKDDRLRRADNAARILKDPLWDDTWKILQSRITAALLSAKTDEGTLRGKLMHQLTIDVRQIWEAYIKDGEYVRNEIKLDKEEKKRGWLRSA